MLKQTIPVFGGPADGQSWPSIGEISREHYSALPGGHLIVEPTLRGMVPADAAPEQILAGRTMVVATPDEPDTPYTFVIFAAPSVYPTGTMMQVPIWTRSHRIAGPHRWFDLDLAPIEAALTTVAAIKILLTLCTGSPQPVDTTDL